MPRVDPNHDSSRLQPAAGSSRATSRACGPSAAGLDGRSPDGGLASLKLLFNLPIGQRRAFQHSFKPPRLHPFHGGHVPADLAKPARRPGAELPDLLARRSCEPP
ncbi:MAG: hypothetical protein K6E40_18385 [Desulfovibrio sp.]|nr:hypothetical protein [Desulfovibrio sp.]